MSNCMPSTLVNVPPTSYSNHGYGCDTAASGNLDLSNIDAGSMVKVNTERDGFVAASGTDVPQHNHGIADITALQDTLNNKATLTHSHVGSDIASGQIPSAVTFVTTDESGFSAAVQARLLEDLPSTNGVIDIARQSTLQDFIADFPVDGDGNLDIAAQTTLESFGATVTSVESGLSALQYLPTFFTDAALPSTPTITGFLQYDANASAWSLVTSTATAPDEINGGNASSFSN